MCLSRLIYTVRPCLIHTCHAMPMPCSCHAPTMPFFSRPQQSTAVQCCGIEKNGMVGAWHGHGMASVNQTRPHCVNQMGNTHSKPLAPRHGHGMLCVNRPLSVPWMGKLPGVLTNTREEKKTPISLSMVRCLMWHWNFLSSLSNPERISGSVSLVS